MNQDLIKLSKTMSHALRHKPEQYGLTLDREGWVPLNDLLATLRQHRPAWSNLQEEDITDMIAQSEKKRFEIREGRIRALYGHSTPEKMERQEKVPPVILYHGTTPQAIHTIRLSGLKPMKRQYVHLSTDVETARQVALRRTNRPIVLKIAALDAYQHGIKFYLGNDMIWLADPIPPQFILFENH